MGTPNSISSNSPAVRVMECRPSQPTTRSAPIRTAIRVEGIVQGVGFRPFVYALATGLGLSGFVGNDVDGVFVEVEGPPPAVAEFLRQLERDPPPLARIERVTAATMTPTGETAFAIGYDGEAYLTGLSPSNTVQIKKPDGLSCDASFDFAPDANGQVRVPGVVCLSTEIKLAAETGGVTVKAKR